MTDNIINRDELQNEYIERIIDGMDHKTMYQYIFDMLEQNFEQYTVDELIHEIEDYYPDLLEDWCHKLVGRLTSWIGGTRNRHSAPDRLLCTHEQNTTLFWL